MLALQDIAVEPALQIRLKTDTLRLRAYADAYQQRQALPPLLVGQVAGGYLLLDGFHRYAAALATCLTTLPCRIVIGTAEEMAWLAAHENLIHGVPLKLAERREVLRRYIRAGRHHKGSTGFKSFREMAAEALAGTAASSTVQHWLQADFPDVFSAISHAGQEDVAQDGVAGRPTLGSKDLALRAVREAACHARALADPVEQQQVANALRAILRELEDAELVTGTERTF